MAKEKDVKYETLVYDALPDRPPRGSQLEDKLDEIKADKALVGKFVCIAQYGQPTAATAAANIARKRHGKPGAYGWTFATRKVTVPGEANERTGLFVSYDPARVVAGEAATFEAEKAERKRVSDIKQAEKYAAKKAQAGNGAKAAAKAAAAK